MSMMSPTSTHAEQEMYQNTNSTGFYSSPTDMCHSPTSLALLPSSISEHNTLTMSAFAPGDGDIPNDPGKMFIGGLSWQTTPESIREYFSIFGELAEVMVMKDPATRRSRGFGFITFSDPSAVEKVLSFPVHQLDGKNVEPKVAVPRKTNPKLVMRTKKIFVGGLSAKTSLEDVKSYFEQFSMVKDAMLAYDKLTNRHRGFGFVTFDNDEVVDKICEIHYHEINGKMVESKKAIPRGTNGYMSAPVNYVNGYNSHGPNGSSYSPTGRNIYGYSSGGGNGGGRVYGNFTGSPQSGGGIYDSKGERGYLDSNAYYTSRHHPFDSLAENNSSDQSRFYNNQRLTNGNKYSQQQYYNERNYKNNEEDDVGFHHHGHYTGGRMVSSNGSTGSSGNNLDDFPPLNNNNHSGLISSI